MTLDSGAPAPVLAAAAAYREALSVAGGRELAAFPGQQLPSSPRVVLYDSQPYDLCVPPLAVARLSINLMTSGVWGAIEGDRPRAYPARRHSLFLTPAGAGAAWRKPGPSRHLSIYLDPRCHDGDAEQAGEATPWRDPINELMLPGTRSLLLALEREATEANPWVDEAVDSLARLLVVQLRRFGRCGSGARRISAVVRARVNEYVEAHLDRRIGVADMAAQADLGADAFARAWLDATGQTPYQYVLGRRVHRAAQLLGNRKLGLAQIAAECGFSSQQHMSDVLRARLGRTPSSLRTPSVIVEPARTD